MPKNYSENVRWLRENGPAPLRWLPNESVFSISERQRGMRRLKLWGNSGGSTDSQGGKNTSIYYLPEHDRERVVRVFLMENTHLIENVSYQGLISRFGDVNKEFQQAARKVLGETDIQRREYPDGYGDHGELKETLAQKVNRGREDTEAP